MKKEVGTVDYLLANLVMVCTVVRPLCKFRAFLIEQTIPATTDTYEEGHATMHGSRPTLTLEDAVTIRTLHF